jgi:hypothetical protein
MEVVEGAWTLGVNIEDPFKPLAAKLAAMAKDLSSWNDRFIGSNKKKKFLVDELILRFDVAMESWVLTQEEHGFRKLLKRNLLGLASLENTIARQRSQITWLAEGDACTQFFHLHVNRGRCKNVISQLKMDRILVLDQDEKAGAVDAC